MELMLSIFKTLLPILIVYFVLFGLLSIPNGIKRRTRARLALLLTVILCGIFVFVASSSGERSEMLNEMLRDGGMGALFGGLFVFLFGGLYGGRENATSGVDPDESILPDSIKRETAADGTEVKVYKHTEDIEAMRERLMREK